MCACMCVRVYADTQLFLFYPSQKKNCSLNFPPTQYHTRSYFLSFLKYFRLQRIEKCAIHYVLFIISLRRWQWQRQLFLNVCVQPIRFICLLVSKTRTLHDSLPPVSPQLADIFTPLLTQIHRDMKKTVTPDKIPTTDTNTLWPEERLCGSRYIIQIPDQPPALKRYYKHHGTETKPGLR